MKSLFANAPKKKPESVKSTEPKEEDLFDHESEDDVIAVMDCE